MTQFPAVNIKGHNTTRKPVSVTDEESAKKPGDRVIVVARFRTIAEAESWIAERELTDPEKVHRGGYGINAPEEMVNPARRLLASLDRRGDR